MILSEPGQTSYDLTFSLFGFPVRQAETDIEQHHCDLGLAIQEITEEVVLLMAKEAKKLSNADYLVLAGGVALNCVSNGKLQSSGIFKELELLKSVMVSINSLVVDSKAGIFNSRSIYDLMISVNST